MVTKKYSYFLFLFLTIILFVNIKSHKVNRFLLSSEKEYKVEGEEKLTKGKRLNSYFRRRILFFLLLLLLFVFLVIIFFGLSDRYKKKVEKEEEEKTVFNDLDLILNSKEVFHSRKITMQNSEGLIANVTDDKEIISLTNGEENIDPGYSYIMTSTIIISKNEGGKLQSDEIYKITEINVGRLNAEKRMRRRKFGDILTRLTLKKIIDLKRTFMTNLDSIRFVFYCCFFHENFNDMFDERDFSEKDEQDTNFNLSNAMYKEYKVGKDSIILFNEENNFKYGDNIYYFDCNNNLLSCKEGNKKNADYFFAKEIFWEGENIYTREGESKEKIEKKMIGTLNLKKRRCFPFVTDYFSKEKIIETKKKLLAYFESEKKSKNQSFFNLNFFDRFYSNLNINIIKKYRNKEEDYLYFYPHTVKDKGDHYNYSHNRKMTEKEKEYYCKQKKDENGFYSCLDDKETKCKIKTKTENAQGRYFVLEELSKGEFYILENVKRSVRNPKNRVYVLPEANAFSENSIFRQLLSNNQKDVLSSINQKKDVKKFKSYLDNLNIFLSGKDVVNGIWHHNKLRREEKGKKGKKVKEITYDEIIKYLNRYYDNYDDEEKNKINKENELSRCFSSVVKNEISAFNFSNYTEENMKEIENKKMDEKTKDDKRNEFYEVELKIRDILNKKHQKASLKKDEDKKIIDFDDVE